MTKPQALTLLRDSVQATRGITQGLWYDGPDQHCTIGSIVQVATDVGFPHPLALHMMTKVIDALGDTLKATIVALTDHNRFLTLTPAGRREKMLRILDNAIALENEHAPALPSTMGEIASYVESATLHVDSLDLFAAVGGRARDTGTALALR